MELPQNDPSENLKMKIGILKIKSQYPNGIRYTADSGHFENYSNQAAIAIKSLNHAIELKNIFDEIKSKNKSGMN